MIIVPSRSKSQFIITIITSVASVRLLIYASRHVMLSLKCYSTFYNECYIEVSLSIIILNLLRRKDYMHLLLLSIVTVLCGLPGPQEWRKLILPRSVQLPLRRKDLCTCILLLYMVVFWLTRLKKNMTLPGESGFWILFSHTWGMSAHVHYIHSKECEINFTNGY